MNRMAIIIKRCWQSLRRAHARVLSRMYAQFRSRTAPIQMGEYTVNFETYCPSILKECNEFGLPIPDIPSRSPNKAEELFLSWRFGWPWPVRIVSRKGRSIVVTATTPEEMGQTIQQIWNSSRAIYSKPTEPLQTMQNNPKPPKRAKQSVIATTSHRAHVVNSPQLPKMVMMSASTIPSTKATEEQQNVSLTEVAGAVIDYSF